MGCAQRDFLLLVVIAQRPVSLIPSPICTARTIAQTCCCVCKHSFRVRNMHRPRLTPDITLGCTHAQACSRAAPKRRGGRGEWRCGCSAAADPHPVRNCAAVMWLRCACVEAVCVHHRMIRNRVENLEMLAFVLAFRPFKTNKLYTSGVRCPVGSAIDWHTWARCFAKSMLRLVILIVLCALFPKSLIHALHTPACRAYAVFSRVCQQHQSTGV